MILTLVRWAYASAFTLGTLRGSGLTLATLELPWIADPDSRAGLAGEPFKSCVPDGEYALVPHSSPKYPMPDRWVFALTNPELGVYYDDHEIPEGQQFGRSKVLIHTANYVTQLLGCIALGRKHVFSGEPAVQDSGAAVRMLRATLGRGTHKLIIRPVQGTREPAL